MGFSATDVTTAVGELADPERAASSAWFFKTGPGEYGEGDVFVGVRVPDLRRVARRFAGIGHDAVGELLASPMHEHRLIGLLLLQKEFERSDDPQSWVDLYVDAVLTGRVNNWDLVDTSAASIMGAWCYRQGDDSELFTFADEQDLWRRRVGIIGTFAYITRGEPSPILGIAPRVLDDRRDLIQKAVGWMLREMGKRIDEALLTGFLAENAAQMGRTALSYAVERLTPQERAHYRSLRAPVRP